MKYQTIILKIAAVIFTPLLLNACGSEDNSTNNSPPITPETETVACDTLAPVFLTDVWPILETDCYSCHGFKSDGSVAVTSNLNVANEQVAPTDFNEINLSVFKAVAVTKDNNNLSWMLSKPTNINNDHGGGSRFAADSPEYTTFQNMVSKLATCSDTTVNLDGVIRNTPYEQLRKSTLSLAARLPTQAEEDAIDAAGNDSAAIQAALDSVADQLMTEEAFYTHLKEMFNDLLLLDAFPGTQLLGTSRLRNFTNNEYFTSDNINAQKNNAGQNKYSTQVHNRIRLNANRGIADAPLELIAHVVRNNRPFTEILTAKYTLVNPYSATIFGADVGDASFNFDFANVANNISTLPDPNDFREVIITDQAPIPNDPAPGKTYPHAGILTTLTYLTRYGSTTTNRNRARSRVTFLYFLDLDVLGLGNRAGLDLDNIKGPEPTLDDEQCSACHTTIDPLAGLFKNWRNNGQFGGDNQRWFGPAKMLQPGYTEFEVDLLPPANSGAALQWLAGRITNDGKFATAMVRAVFKGLTGQTLSKQIPQEAEFLETLKTNFINGNFEIRVVIKEIINSLYFTAKNLGSDEVPEDFAKLGMGRLLTPEQLHRKIVAVTGGYAWKSPANRNLNDRYTYRLLYGGIDSISVTERTTDPTALIEGTQQRIALQTACQSVPLDFNKSVAGDRALFPLVEIGDTPDTPNGELKIKQNIKHLYKQILGEKYSIGHAEVARAYQLFVGARTAILTSTDAIPSNCRGGLAANNSIVTDNEKTVRPWMAVVAYLLSDYQFLYE